VARALLALGSNQGDRAGYLLSGLSALSRADVRPLRLSRVYETDPLGPPGQGRYLNQVALVETGLEPEALLRLLLSVEKAHGRVRAERYGPRTLDLDLLDYEGRVLDLPGLTLPHPRMHARAFVLVPLLEVAPRWRHPVLGRTARELLAGLEAGGVRPYLLEDPGPELPQ